MKKYWAKRIFMFVIFFIVAVMVFGAIVMGLWNAILPSVIGVKTITFIQALGILLLSKILFVGFGYRGGWHRGKHEQWRNKWREKWVAMTPEEREKFKAEWKNRCGRGRWNMHEENQSGAMAE
jgi:Ca2+/H+ antiporter, TMEM165/GDT1 family